MKKDLSALQNGSDIRGVALKIEDGSDVNLSADEAASIAAAFVRYLSEKCKKRADSLKIGVGHDSRLTANSLSAAALRGIMA
ncbi:MAG: phosphomannomutase/phosphoglucomutase, partial [Oscillospiraceae bacterium]|nr:phosphomannomutase/phosphoglucomutase [Oscillospiraceae bacterium]